jgi:hypothetical protein
LRARRAGKAEEGIELAQGGIAVGQTSAPEAFHSPTGPTGVTRIQSRRAAWTAISTSRTISSAE